MTQPPTVHTREARESDVPAIRDVFMEVYGEDYPFQGFYDDWWLKRSVFGDDIIMLVAEDETGEILGTASVVLDIASHTDLAAEFGRLAVRPSARGRGIGNLLMEGRLEISEDRLHVGVVENRSAHTFSQRISLRHGFAPVGFLPLRHKITRRESITLFARHFGDALELRNNHPRIIPEAAPIAHIAMRNMGLKPDVILDEEATAYPGDVEFVIDEGDGRGVPALVRIERGRVHKRELFGPVQLHYGFFKLSARRANYLVARHGIGGAVAGAVGFIHDEFEETVAIFELISQTDEAIRFLLEELLERCEHEWGVAYVEANVNAHAPRMQRTLIELGFVTAAYVPALVFSQVERLDVIKMTRVFDPSSVETAELIPEMEPIAALVRRALRRQAVLPQVAGAVHRLRLFEGLNEEQVQRVAARCSVETYAEGAPLFSRGGEADSMVILIEGRVEILSGDPPRKIGEVRADESLGELALVTGEPHSADAIAKERVVAAVLARDDLQDLTRRRPDIGVLLYRELAAGLGRKLRRADTEIVFGERRSEPREP